MQDLINYYNEICNYYEEKYRIILDPDSPKEKVDSSFIEYDNVKWRIEPNIEKYMDTFIYDTNLSFEDKVLKVYEYICLNYIYDDNVLFFFKKRVDENGNKIYIPDDSYARVVGEDWYKTRLNHNKRVCYEFSRFFAKAIEKIRDVENKEVSVCILGLIDNTHYIIGITEKDYSITLDLDNFNRIKDLTRLKLGLTLQGITILRDNNNIIANKIKEYNYNKSDDLQEVKKLDKSNFIEYIEKVVEILRSYKLDPQGFMEYMKQKLTDNDVDTDKVWKEVPNSKEKNYVRNLFFSYNNESYIIDSISQTIKRTKKEDVEHEYIVNPEEHKYKYYGG